MPRYERGESSSSSGSYGKGSSSRDMGTFAGIQASRPSRGARNNEALPSTSRQINHYEIPELRTPPDRRNPLGKHRVRVKLNRLNQEIALLREELKAIDNTPPASRACEELVIFMETCADPLLPVTPGPVMAEWDRWSSQNVETTTTCCW